MPDYAGEFLNAVPDPHFVSRASESILYTHTSNTVPPTVTVISPSNGSLVTSNTPIVMDITDDEGLIANVMLAVSYPNGSTEIAMYQNKGDDVPTFSAAYSSSTVTPITNGMRVTLRRVPGWLGSPTVIPAVSDFAGNVSGG